VLDAIREVKPPFSPDSVVIEFSDLIKSYGIRRVTGDRYGGDWPRERFRVQGIEYVPSELTKSDIYRNTLPLLNSGRIELLDNARLASQLCGLERRTARSGKDSIDHAPGGHDDIANAAAGALLLANSTAASLWRHEALLVDGAGAPDPSRCDVVFAVLTSTPTGDAACAYFSMTRFAKSPLILIDFICEQLSPAFFSGVIAKLGTLSKSLNASRNMIYTSAPLAAELERSHCLRAEVADGIIDEGEALALAAAVHISAGRVKLSSTALASSEKTPLSLLAGAADDDEDDPVRRAALVGIALALDANRSLAKNRRSAA
jgi:hypothetical protein